MFGAGNIDWLGIAAGTSILAAGVLIFWLIGNDDWRDALIDEPFGDVIEPPSEAKSGDRRETGAGGAETSRRKTGDNTHRSGSSK